MWVAWGSIAGRAGRLNRQGSRGLHVARGSAHQFLRFLVAATRTGNGLIFANQFFKRVFASGAAVFENWHGSYFPRKQIKNLSKEILSRSSPIRQVKILNCEKKPGTI